MKAKHLHDSVRTGFVDGTHERVMALIYELSPRMHKDLSDAFASHPEGPLAIFKADPQPVSALYAGMVHAIQMSGKDVPTPKG